MTIQTEPSLALADDEMLTLPKAAQRLGISLYRLKGLVERGKISPRRDGARDYVSVHEIRRYLGDKPSPEFTIPGLQVDYRVLAQRLKEAPGSRVGLVSPLLPYAGISEHDRAYAIEHRLMLIDGMTPTMLDDVAERDDYWFDTVTYDVIGRGEEGWEVVLHAPSAVPSWHEEPVTLLHWTLVNTLRSTNVLEAIRELHGRAE